MQSVKTLTAGQNYTNNQTAVKTRKLPLTVAAQFQNSLIALMETLNQVSRPTNFFLYKTISIYCLIDLIIFFSVLFSRQIHFLSDVLNQILIRIQINLMMQRLLDR